MSLKRLILVLAAFVLLLLIGYQWLGQSSLADDHYVLEGAVSMEAVAPIDIPPTIEIVEEPAAQIEPVPDIEVDRVIELFNTFPPQLPIVETVTYKSRVPWLKGRSAWISDYATHYKTSRHFISRSLSGKVDYYRHDIKDGNRFTVLKPDVSFYLLLDTSRHRLWLYYVDGDEKGLIKSYPVSIGRLDESKASGLLTPHGIYRLGDKVAVHDETTKGHFQGEKVQLIRIFGTRWIPFQDEVANCTASAKGFGIHGVPWSEDSMAKKLVEDPSSIGQYESDGCIRLKGADVEELYAIIVSRPTTIEIVDDYYKAVK
jgi:hypothetical protein